ncbi:SDR family oxidoreductase [Rariglobus hedericola]|uniref:dTDP-4-dehydrorhamnose reductase n=1 Tax=Rariglobus hedericola TaxID=2597822 RepID=A0A556QGU9_9BACT|nr:SDR family oxidoreductase [Rariglobus hedericola]TSJ75859.1 SDR family oxidoreductase [Rariglobus hedericola]
MKILLTGASGLVGSAFAQAATRRGHQVTGLVGNHPGSVPGLAAQRTADLTDEAALTATVLELFPDAIVNCAAISEPAQCDADPARAQALNVALPATLARLANHLSARLVHLSSEQVFDGTSPAPYTVKSPVKPINLYARQKVESERLVHTAAPDFAITLRAPLLTGNSLTGKRSLHERLFADWSAGKTPKVYTDEFRQPCTASNLSDLMVELLERNDARGVFHWAGADTLSRYELARRIRAHFKLSDTAAPLETITRDGDPRAASKRQASLALDLKPLAGVVKTPIETFAAQLDQFIIPPAYRAWYFSA